MILKTMTNHLAITSSSKACEIKNVFSGVLCYEQSVSVVSSVQPSKSNKIKSKYCLSIKFRP